MTRQTDKASADSMSKISLEAVVDWLGKATFQAWTNALSGNPSIKQERYWNRANNPEIGDLVFEITAFNRPAIMRIGWLNRIEREPWPDWDEAEDGPAETREVWIIRTLDGKEQRRENCKFIVVPTKPDMA